MWRHHPGRVWKGPGFPQPGMFRVMAVPWIPVATSVLRTTPTLTTQQVLTCGKHPVTRTPPRAASHMDCSTGIKDLLEKLSSFVPTHPTVIPKPTRVSWTFYPLHPTVIPEP